MFSLGCVIVELCAALRLGSKKGFLERTVQNHFGFVLDEAGGDARLPLIVGGAVIVALVLGLLIYRLVR